MRKSGARTDGKAPFGCHNTTPAVGPSVKVATVPTLTSVPAFTTGRDDIRDDVSVCRPAQRIDSAHGVQITGRNVRSAGQIDFLVGTTSCQARAS
jgi:hypothetical protein